MLSLSKLVDAGIRRSEDRELVYFQVTQTVLPTKATITDR